jgi:hypothetical protein
MTLRRPPAGTVPAFELSTFNDRRRASRSFRISSWSLTREEVNRGLVEKLHGAGLAVMLLAPAFTVNARMVGPGYPSQHPVAERPHWATGFIRSPRARYLPPGLVSFARWPDNRKTSRICDRKDCKESISGLE